MQNSNPAAWEPLRAAREAASDRHSCKLQESSPSDHNRAIEPLLQTSQNQKRGMLPEPHRRSKRSTDPPVVTTRSYTKDSHRLATTTARNEIEKDDKKSHFSDSPET
ncbi:unnamed protein product [Microthlaspi erraticum]|uniref:Uncharacterized protein n=1 Tax=Microthlaspi erraticum TaxID=1685480 RepID=A0A6D2IJA9_9BRAS|nr:unnamed protein product [Microthlaspi erraticum]